VLTTDDPGVFARGASEVVLGRAPDGVVLTLIHKETRSQRAFPCAVDASRDGLRPWVRLARQPWWHVVLVDTAGDVRAALEFHNTLDVLGLLRQR
jgi:hypothetical protein